MGEDYDSYTVRELREKVFESGLIEKRWMLTYIRKKEAITLLSLYTSADEVPENYMKIIRERNSKHRKKVYMGRKRRQEKFGAPLSREERFKLAANEAESLKYKERKVLEDGFTSFLGSTRAKIAFVFVDGSGKEYLFTRSEVQKLKTMGLSVPRGVLTTSSQPKTEAAKKSKKLKDLF